MNATIALRSHTTIPVRMGANVAGFAYVGAWVLGLTAFGVAPATDATDSQIARYFADHRALSTIQSMLIHGVAAIALLVVLAAVNRLGRLTRLALAAGITAAALSLLQCILDIYRSVVAHGTTVATLAHAVDRIDGLKMFAFAVMIGASISLFRTTGMIGRKMTITTWAAVAALVVSGIAYAGHVTGLLATAELSLVLLLVWVAYTGVATHRATR